MTGHSFGRFAVLLGLPLLAGCGPGGWFGGEEVPPLPGTRISILELAEGLEPDPLVADLTVAVPPPSLNLEWPQAGGRPDHAPGNVSLSYPLEQIWSADVGTGSGGNRRLLTAPIAEFNAIRSGEAYVNVHTLQSFPGEIRGQIY